MRVRCVRLLMSALTAAGVLATTVTGCGTDGDSAESAAKPAQSKAARSEPTGDKASVDGQEASAKPAEPSASAKPRKPAPPAPDWDDVPKAFRFASKTLDGEAFDGATLAGKPTVLWFWAPWCGSCQGQAPQTAKLADRYKGKVNFLGVAGLDKTGPMREFVSQRKVGGFPHLADEKGSVWKKFQITEQSSFVMLDAKGRTVHSGVPAGPSGLDSLVAGLAG